jgi:hypothetical protein
VGLLSSYCTFVQFITSKFEEVPKDLTVPVPLPVPVGCTGSKVSGFPMPQPTEKVAFRASMNFFTQLSAFSQRQDCTLRCQALKIY